MPEKIFLKAVEKADLKRQLKNFVNEKWQNVKKILSHSTGEIF